MARTAFIYQCWSGEDMAESDTWYATLTQARKHAVDSWEVPASSVRLDHAGNWDGEARDGSVITGYDVHIARHAVELTKDGVCDALTFWPNR